MKAYYYFVVIMADRLLSKPRNNNENGVFPEVFGAAFLKKVQRERKKSSENFSLLCLVVTAELPFGEFQYFAFQQVATKW